jgi:fibrillarin-like pre-rRNA processing protein
MENKSAAAPAIKYIGNYLATKKLNGSEGDRKEEVIEHGVAYRLWNPYNSKLSAAIISGLKNMHIKEKSKVLYLGAANGTTCSHISDIIGPEGLVYCIEISERSMRDLLQVCETRPNMIPILSDARNTDSYAAELSDIDIIYQDVSARDQAEILLANEEFLKPGGYAYAAIKSQSIDVSKDPNEVYKEFISKVSKRMELIETIDISRYDKMHLFVVFRKPIKNPNR